MTADQRNFRSAYLEKVGIKGVEEKKSIEILLKEPFLDLSKLFQFCLRFVVPASYRNYIWKVLLGVLPPHQASHDFVMHQRRVQYNDLKEALAAMRRITGNTPQEEVFLKMYLIEEEVLPFEENKILRSPGNKKFLCIAKAMPEFADDPVEVYWMTKNFFKLTEKFRDSLTVMKERLEYYILKEDSDKKLHAHLCEMRVFTHVPFDDWFCACFAGVLHSGCLDRIWDKIIGGSCKILVYVAVAILLTLRRPLLSMKSIDHILSYLSQIPEDSGDIIVSKAIELWQKNGSLLQPMSAKSESPSTMDRPPS